MPQSYCLEGFKFFHRKKKLPNIDRKKLYAYLRHAKCVDYWLRHGHFSSTALNHINWEAVGRSMRNLTLARRRWVVKYATGNYGVGTTLMRWKIQKDPACSLCSAEEETCEHVFQCPSQVAVTRREYALANLSSWFENKHTDPNITKIIIDALKAWFVSSTYTVPFAIASEYSRAYAAQESIGWYNFLLGITARQWADCQQNYYLSLGRRNTGLHWVIELQKKMINVSWDLWNTRCSERWKPDNARDTMALDELHKAIEEEYERGVDEEFPARSRHLFEDDLEEILHYSLPARKAWLQSVEAARIYTLPANDDNDEPFAGYEPHRKLMHQWMATKRY